ncbi:uncharacterized protein BO88DRAFT_423186 [Aspergillus vadensis CBS 113365]|uniref:Uncharacterized protein n=1 Tax=Aspergillus vadensis (strain CBS 113365 / IMI 142717 / IBT 24658) TaxID=1448311 RepID=A0A319BKD7_ASPVC|nr:hypothetical protein BO88DRAFT_423186 [Aspergillus vadensis CBS 113365]PYH72369.1 hypothetical protein BO88DRAFT_423186 [Aspergillus vadensis CBS 113365]
MGMGVKTPGELGRIAGVILGETGERESRPSDSKFESRRRKTAQKQSLSGEITHDASATAGQAVITALLTGHTECITASRTTDRLLRNPMWPAPPGFAPGTSWAAFRRPSHSVVLAGNEGGPQGVEESGGSLVQRGKTKPALLVMEEESDLIFKCADDGIGWSWRNCVIALGNEVMLSPA